MVNTKLLENTFYCDTQFAGEMNCSFEDDKHHTAFQVNTPNPWAHHNDNRGGYKIISCIVYTTVNFIQLWFNTASLSIYIYLYCEWRHVVCVQIVFDKLKKQTCTFYGSNKTHSYWHSQFYASMTYQLFLASDISKIQFASFFKLPEISKKFSEILIEKKICL